jgi:HlyD family secretion protein
MRRVLVPLVLLITLITGALIWKLRAQEEALTGPPGGSGVVEGTEINLASKLASRVIALHVRQGDAVQEGQLLMELDCADSEAVVAEAEAKLRAARAQVVAAEAQSEAVGGNRDAARISLSSAGSKINALATKRDSTEREAKRLEQLGEHVAASKRDQLRAAADGLTDELQAARVALQANKRQIQATGAQQRAAQAQAESAAFSIEAVEAAIGRARLLLEECKIRAPRAAIVDQVYYEPGELTRPAMPLIRLVDLAQVTATFYLPNVEIGAVKVGQRALVEADAFRDQPVEGRVITVSTEAEFTPRNIQTRTDRDRLVYPIEVLVPNSGTPVLLRPGMPVQVTLVGEAP